MAVVDLDLSADSRVIVHAFGFADATGDCGKWRGDLGLESALASALASTAAAAAAAVLVLHGRERLVGHSVLEPKAVELTGLELALEPRNRALGMPVPTCRLGLELRLQVLGLAVPRLEARNAHTSQILATAMI